MRSFVKEVIQYFPIFGVVLGILYNLSYWAYLDVDYFSYVGFQEIFVSSVPAIFLSFGLFALISCMIGLFTYLVRLRFGNGEDGNSRRSIVEVFWIFELALLVLGGVHFAMYWYADKMVDAFGVLALSGAGILALFFLRFLLAEGYVKEKKAPFFLNVIFVIFVGIVLMNFLGFRLAYALKTGEYYYLFYGKEGYGRYAGKVGDYHVFWQSEGKVRFVLKDEIGSFVKIKVIN